MATLPPRQEIPTRGSTPAPIPTPVPIPVPTPTSARNVPERDAPMWLQRISLAVLVVTCIYLGLMLAILPWTNIWQENRMLSQLPLRFSEALQSGAVRGVVSGLGLLDVWIGIRELAAWRARRRHPVR